MEKSKQAGQVLAKLLYRQEHVTWVKNIKAPYNQCSSEYICVVYEDIDNVICRLSLSQRTLKLLCSRKHSL